MKPETYNAVCDKLRNAVGYLNLAVRRINEAVEICKHDDCKKEPPEGQVE